MIKFLNEKTTASAHEHLEEKLRDRKVANRKPVFDNVFAYHQQFLIFKIDKVPGNSTPFAFLRSVVYTTADMCQLHMQTENKSMSDERCSSLEKQKLFIPELVNDA